MQFIDLKTQYKNYKTEIDKSIQDVLDSSSYILGPTVERCEKELAEFTGTKYCVGVGSGTDALLIALMALKIGTGDEVITTPYTWISTVEVISFLGATPIFVDVEKDSFNIDLSKIEEKITANTKAIMPVSLFGLMADMQKINALGDKYNIPIIEDGAQSFGATRNGKMSCGDSLIGATSFFPAKPLGCYGDGGALFTNDKELDTLFRTLRVHGGLQRGTFTHIGITGRLDAIQAAVINAKLPYFAKEIELRKEVAKRYDSLLEGLCVTPQIDESCTSTYAMYTIRIEEREVVTNALKEAGIPFGIYYDKVAYEQPAYSHLNSQRCPVAESLGKEVLSLPMHPWLKEQEQEKIASVIKNAKREVLV